MSDKPAPGLGATLCPVCSGRGIVPNGFYSATTETWASTSANPETCRSCEGEGYLREAALTAQPALSYEHRETVCAAHHVHLCGTCFPNPPSADWAKELAGEIVGLCSAWFDGRRGFNSKDAEFTKVRVAPLITQAVNLQVGAAYLACAENIKKSRAFITQLHVWFERQFGESTEVQRSKAQHVLDILEAAAGEIGRLTPEAAARALQEHDAKLQIEAIEQCAIEAGERSPEGVSSHTMLGDMWDERVTKLRAALATTFNSLRME